MVYTSGICLPPTTAQLGRTQVLTKKLNGQSLGLPIPSLLTQSENLTSGRSNLCLVSRSLYAHNKKHVMARRSVPIGQQGNQFDLKAFEKDRYVTFAVSASPSPFIVVVRLCKHLAHQCPLCVNSSNMLPQTLH
eukprot:5563700-Pyramimonas_sp.AAC.1